MQSRIIQSLQAPWHAPTPPPTPLSPSSSVPSTDDDAAYHTIAGLSKRPRIAHSKNGAAVAQPNQTAVSQPDPSTVRVATAQRKVCAPSLTNIFVSEFVDWDLEKVRNNSKMPTRRRIQSLNVEYWNMCVFILNWNALN